MNILESLKEKISPLLGKAGISDNGSSNSVKEEKFNHVNSKVISDVANIWTFYTSKLLSGNAMADWQDISDSHEDILAFDLKSQNEFKIHFIIHLDWLMDEPGDTLEQKALYSFAKAILSILQEADIRETDEMSFAYDMNLKSAKNVDNLHIDEKYIMDFAQALYLISVDKDFMDHIHRASLIEGIELRNQQDSLSTWRRIVNDLGLQELRTTDEWLTVFDKQKKLLRIKFRAMRPNGLKKITLCLYADDLKKDNFTKLIRNKLKAQVTNIDQEILSLTKSDYSSEDQQRLIDDLSFYKSLKDKL